MEKDSGQFEVGTVVAVVHSSSWGRRRFTKGKIAKVYKTGHVVLEGEPQGIPPKRFRVSHNGNSATETGRGYHKDRLEIWTEEHDQEIASAKQNRVVAAKVSTLVEWLSNKRNGLGDYFLSNEQVGLIDQLLETKRVDDEQREAERKAYEAEREARRAQ